MATFLGNPVAAFFDSNGVPLAGGKLYVFDAGTVTPRSAYPTIADAEADTNALAHPIVLDSRGEATVVLTGSNKLQLDDSADVNIWTVDNFNISTTVDSDSFTDSSGNEYIKFTQTTDAVNEFTIANAATGNNAIVSMTGDDANVSGIYRVKGPSGTFTFQDGNSNETLTTGAATSGAINELAFTNAATTTGPIINATGGDSNISVGLQPKGTGVVSLSATSTTASGFRVYEDTDNGSNYLGFVAPALLTASLDFTFPDGDGSSGQVLGTDGSNNYTWNDTPSTAATQAEQEAFTSTSLFSSPGRQHYHPSAAKVWADATNGGTVNASLNVDSATNISTGTVRINFTTAFSSADYAVIATADDTTDARAIITNQTATDCTVKTTEEDGIPVNANVHVMAYGDQ